MSWYRMHRGWMDDPIFKRDKFSRRDAWVWLIETAAFEDTKDFVCGKPTIIPRGALVRTERQLAKEWKWGRQSVRTFLSHLQVDEKIVLNLTHQLTQISIVNYDTYQKKQPSSQPKANPALTQDQPTYKELKNIRTKEKTILFDKFWFAYPKKINKKAAERKFLQCVDRGVTVDEIIKGAKNYAAWCKSEKQPARYIQAPDAWLNKGRWDDELEVSPQTLTESNEIDWEKERDW